jgi:hypothetical protein
MKRFILSAEFSRWKVPDNSEIHHETMTNVVELESEEEARTRLESMIIERMSSKPGWTYELLSSGYKEFSEESNTTLPSEVDPQFTITAIEEPLVPDYISEMPILPEQEIIQTATPDQMPLPDIEADPETPGNDQIPA